MPHKICPQCGQPAVLDMAQCRRCGFLYVPHASTNGSRAYSAPLAEMPSAQRAAQQRRSRALPLLLISMLVIGLFGIALVVRSFLGFASRHSAVSGSGMPAGSALNGAPADAASPPGNLSFFVESDGKQEMPVLTFRNMDDDTLTLTLRDSAGHVYKATSRLEQLATLQVPAGYYSLSIECDNPRIRPNWGDATFRKFKTYHADFVVGHRDERIHLGE